MKRILFITFLVIGVSSYGQITPVFDGVEYVPLTTTEINAIVSPSEGRLEYNSTTKTMWVFNGTIWIDTGSGGGSGLSNIVEDTTPELGGELDASDENIVGVATLNVDRIVLSNTTNNTRFSILSSTQTQRTDVVYNNIFFNNDGNIQIAKSNETISPNTNWNFVFGTNNTAVRQYDFQDASGTVAFLSDIGSGSGDNLGNHTATTDLDMDGSSILDALYVNIDGYLNMSNEIRIIPDNVIGTGVGSNNFGFKTGNIAYFGKLGIGIEVGFDYDALTVDQELIFTDTAVWWNSINLTSGGGGIPDDNSVSTVKLQDESVTFDKLGNSAVRPYNINWSTTPQIGYVLTAGSANLVPVDPSTIGTDNQTASQVASITEVAGVVESAGDTESALGQIANKVASISIDVASLSVTADATASATNRLYTNTTANDYELTIPEVFGNVGDFIVLEQLADGGKITPIEGANVTFLNYFETGTTVGSYIKLRQTALDTWVTEIPNAVAYTPVTPPANLPVFVDAGTYAESTSSATIDVPYPATVNADDFLVLQVQTRNNTDFSVPAGWTLINDTNITESAGTGTKTNALFYKYATGSETGNLTVTHGDAASSLTTGIISRFDNVHLTVPYEDLNLTGPDTYDTTLATGTGIPISSVTSTGTFSLAVAFTYFGDLRGISTSPSEYTTQGYHEGTSTSIDDNLGLFYVTLATASTVAADAIYYDQTVKTGGSLALILLPE